MPSTDRSFPWDLFVSYATEDRDEIAKPLVETLTQFGLNVWWDQFELTVGDSLLRAINRGLAGSRFGVVIISERFLAKRWTEYELTGLTTRELAGAKVVLPVWYGVTAEEILQYSPPLADKKAVVVPAPPTPDRILDAGIAILEVVNPELLTRIHRRTVYELTMRRGGERTTADPREILMSRHRHEALPDALIGRIRLIRAALLGSHPGTMAHWIDGFRRDAHPTKEVEIWEHIAATYLEIRQYLTLTADEAQAVFVFFLMNASGGDDPPPLPESLEPHRDLLIATFQSMHPVLEIAEEKRDAFANEAPEGDPPGTHVEDFEDRISPELAKRLADRAEKRTAPGR